MKIGGQVYCLPGRQFPTPSRHIDARALRILRPPRTFREGQEEKSGDQLAEIVAQPLTRAFNEISIAR